MRWAINPQSQRFSASLAGRQMGMTERPCNGLDAIFFLTDIQSVTQRRREVL
jgi:hypothetical protein